MNTHEEIYLELNKLTFNSLDIGDQVGHTDYIDFISSKDASDDIMTGIDIYHRKFFTIKATIKSDNIEIHTFSIFFQRYTDNEFRWQMCGNCHPYLFDTSGGISLEQLNLLYNLMTYNKVTLNSEQIIDYRLNNIIPKNKNIEIVLG